MESTLCLSARWSNSTLGRLSFLQGVRGKGRIGATPAPNSSLHPSQHIENQLTSGVASPSGSCPSVLVAKHSLSSKILFTEFEILQPGATVEKQLGVDRSFLLTIEKCSVILSFSAAMDFSSFEGEKLRVHVHLLVPEETIDTNSAPQDVTLLKSIREGTGKDI
ncbi:hypothetical protein AJ78_03682 [Emergomyces pasteurianus Ep9510]|uniref:Uncharacterized protein n=1 Tax=Emergomyces pasteurianus Ep9510 TaxID=1447872 RepID=A0A1J9PJ88_9EURO|nr:hypothetical protein AJ78_03682 [Emergomyces pasteurianus Ep9510]